MSEVITKKLLHYVYCDTFYSVAKWIFYLSEVSFFLQILRVEVWKAERGLVYWQPIDFG